MYLILARDLDESFGILVRLGAKPCPSLPASIQRDSRRPSLRSFAKRLHRDQREPADLLAPVIS